ncbi:hypothetical protein FQN54_008378 [Arachnomyces sp. PD_36]|nr:hypothetical protein FQN54_008378 [Arachnomyces sp. PD_36]
MPPHNRQMMLMDEARAAASFDSYGLGCIIYQSEDTLQRRREALRRVEHVTGTADTSKLPQVYANTNREDTYLHGLAQGKAAVEDGIKHGHNFFSHMTHRYTLSNASPFGMHFLMFKPTVELQGTAEQIAYWVPLINSCKIIGSYCQTEIGHGSFVRGLETTATFDRRTDEFVINSPTPSSAKFWPGAMAMSCTHGIVVARLIIGDKDHGPHLFIVQFRSLKDFSLTPGLETGDLGQKMAYNGTCNGYATFKNVRIPRSHMLMGSSRVLRDGTYIKPPHDKLTYSTMLYVRTLIVGVSAFKLAQAATIATRYSIVREQGFLDPNSEISDLGSAEVAIMSYKSQHYRILSTIAKSYAILFASFSLDSEYRECLSLQRQNDYSTLRYCHVLSSGLKAWSTQVAADGAEDVRKCCGGHGYLATSGLPEIVTEAVATATLEGDIYVMYQQVGRYLLTCIRFLMAGKPIDEKKHYLSEQFQRWRQGPVDRCHASGNQFLDAGVQCSLFKHRAFRLAYDCANRLEETQRSEKLTAAQAWNRHMMSIISAARAHIEVIVLESVIQHVSTVTDPSIHRVLDRLRSLFALTTITNPQSIDAVSFVEDQHLSAHQMTDIRSCVDDLLEQLLPEAVGLTDAWDFTDSSLCSAIGQRDGNAYETLMAWTKQIPLNASAKRHGGIYLEGWEKWIKPVLNQEPRAKL